MNAQMIPATPASPLTTATTSLSLEALKSRLRRLNLYGLLAHAEEIIAEPWLERVLEIEESERQSRSLKRRLGNARLGAFKPLVDFDYGWPTELDRDGPRHRADQGNLVADPLHRPGLPAEAAARFGGREESRRRQPESGGVHRDVRRRFLGQDRVAARLTNHGGQR